MTRTVIIITFLFIAMTLPGAVVSSLYVEIFSRPDFQNILRAALGCSFSYHAYSVVVLYLTNRKFAKELRSLFAPLYILLIGEKLRS